MENSRDRERNILIGEEESGSQPKLKKIGLVYLCPSQALDSYIDFLRQFGIVKLVMENEFIQDLDLLIIPSFGDLDPMTNTYDRRNSNLIKRDNSVKSSVFQEFALRAYVSEDIPIFGINSGMQMLASSFGSVLYSNIVGHNTPTQFHKVFLDKEDNEVLHVNSLHHQGIKILGSSLTQLAHTVSKDGKPCLCEAFSHSTMPIYGVQWEPQAIYNTLEGHAYSVHGYLIGDSLSIKIIRNLLRYKDATKPAK